MKRNTKLLVGTILVAWSAYMFWMLKKGQKPQEPIQEQPVQENMSNTKMLTEPPKVKANL